MAASADTYRDNVLSLMYSHMFRVVIILSFQEKRALTEALLRWQASVKETNKAVQDACASGGTFLNNNLLQIEKSAVVREDARC